MGGLAGCGRSLPGNAVQPSNRVEQGVVIGVRGVAARSPAVAMVSGTGSQAEHAEVNTAVFEYIIRKANDDLVSVTQTDKTPLALWQKVQVIAGNRARVVPDYAALAGITAVRSEMRRVDVPVEETLSAPAAVLQP